MSENNENNVVPIQSARPGTPLSDAQMAELKKQFWTDVLNQIIDTPRFIEFIDANYTIMKGVDEETKTIHINVIEKPPIERAKQLLTPEQVFKIRVLCSSVRDPGTLTNKILEVIGQESSLITTATDADVNAAIQQESLKNKLDPG